MPERTGVKSVTNILLHHGQYLQLRQRQYGERCRSAWSHSLHTCVVRIQHYRARLDSIKTSNPGNITFDYLNPAEDIEEGESKLVLSKIHDRRPHSIGNIVRVVIELVLVIASVVNLASLSWTLTLNTIAVTSCDNDMLVEL